MKLTDPFNSYSTFSLRPETEKNVALQENLQKPNDEIQN